MNNQLFLNKELENIKNQILQFGLKHNFDFSDFYVESDYNELLNKKKSIEKALNN